MAFLDYGALLKVNGEFINKNTDLFMESSDTNYIIDKAKYRACNHNDKYYDTDIQINGNYFVYAGDKDLLLCFYKCMFYVIENGIITKCMYELPFIKEDLILNNGTRISIKHLDENKYSEKYYDYDETWQDYVKKNWSKAMGNEKDYELENGKKAHKNFIKHKKRIARNKNCIGKYYKSRYIATWTHNDKTYEVIFGYGIDNNEKVYNRIKNNSYDYSKIEVNIIDKWFK